MNHSGAYFMFYFFMLIYLMFILVRIYFNYTAYLHLEMNHLILAMDFIKCIRLQVKLQQHSYEVNVLGSTILLTYKTFSDVAVS